MAEGRRYSIHLYVPDEPMEAQDGVTVRISSVDGQKTKVWEDPTKTRDQLLTDALTAIRSYVRQFGRES